MNHSCDHSVNTVGIAIFVKSEGTTSSEVPQHTVAGWALRIVGGDLEPRSVSVWA